MGRPISPNRLKALKMWLNSNREMKPKEIAEELGISSSQVRKWKSVDRWDDIPDTPRKRGAPYRNKNAVGNKGGGAPEGNENAVKHGLFRKWLPDDDELIEIYDAARDGMSMLDILYEEILISFTNIIRAQKIMYVKDQNDMTKEVKKSKSYESDKDSSEEIEYEIQFAWDKQAKALTSQAAAMRSLSNKIKQYEEMIRTLPPEEVKEEHRLRVEKMKADIKAVEAKAW
ncbi:phage terminase small subunit [Oceanobacillus damuensis]|uniref:phage terminase small subunit n=1 Tax=Oceanobacillus damuensis TaxID=937928 RepID=UPI00082E7F41|nr:phage terminase small subunit [Oceanobacillus damuensis]